MRSGRPTVFASRRSNIRSSSGRTLYFFASARNFACNSASFFGFFAATSFARLKSDRTS